MIYLDHNASAPVRPSVIEVMTAALRAGGNPSSIHASGRQARRKIEAVRAAIGAAINLPAGGGIVFTSGGTEANQLAIRGAGCQRVFASAIEHDSVRNASPAMISIPVTPQGVVDLEVLDRLLAEEANDQPALVSVMAANNETGILQPVGDIAKIVHGHGAILHCDAVQVIGRVPFDMAALGIDTVTLSGHKIGGPQGVGAFAIRPGLKFDPILTGGGQEYGLRSGTENVAGILGLGAAIAEAQHEFLQWRKVALLRDYLEKGALKAFPEVTIFGKDVARLPNTTCLAPSGVPAETQIIGLDLAGIAVSAGAACSSGKLQASHVLGAMGADAGTARSAIRVSLCRDTARSEVDAFLEAWTALLKRHAARNAA